MNKTVWPRAAEIGFQARVRRGRSLGVVARQETRAAGCAPEERRRPTPLPPGATRGGRPGTLLPASNLPGCTRPRRSSARSGQPPPTGRRVRASSCSRSKLLPTNDTWSPARSRRAAATSPRRTGANGLRTTPAWTRPAQMKLTNMSPAPVRISARNPPGDTRRLPGPVDKGDCIGTGSPSLDPAGLSELRLGAGTVDLLKPLLKGATPARRWHGAAFAALTGTATSSSGDAFRVGSIWLTTGGTLGLWRRGSSGGLTSTIRRPPREGRHVTRPLRTGSTRSSRRSSRVSRPTELTCDAKRRVRTARPPAQPASRAPSRRRFRAGAERGCRSVSVPVASGRPTVALEPTAGLL